MRVVFAEHLADIARALGKSLGSTASGVAHRVEDAALHRLQAVGDLGQRARLDGRDRVAEVRVRRMLLDRRRFVAAIGSEEIQRLCIVHKPLKGDSHHFLQWKRSSCLSDIAMASSTARFAASRSSAAPARPAASHL